MLGQDFSYQGNHSQLNPRDTFNPNLEQKHQHFVIHLSQFYPPIYLQGIAVFPSPVIPTTFFRNRERNHRSASRRRKIRKTKKKRKEGEEGGEFSRAREGEGWKDSAEEGIRSSRRVQPWNKEVAGLFHFIAPFKLCNCIPRRATCAFFTALLRADYAEFIVTKADTMQRRLDAR